MHFRDHDVFTIWLSLSRSSHLSWLGSMRHIYILLHLSLHLSGDYCWRWLCLSQYDILLITEKRSSDLWHGISFVWWRHCLTCDVFFNYVLHYVHTEGIQTYLQAVPWCSLQSSYTQSMSSCVAMTSSTIRFGCQSLCHSQNRTWKPRVHLDL